MAHIGWSAFPRGEPVPVPSGPVANEQRSWWRARHWPVTQIQLIHFPRLCPLSSSITDLSRNEEVPYDQASELFHCYLHLNFSPQFQATFCSPTLSSLITDKELLPGFVKELQRHGTDIQELLGLPSATKQTLLTTLNTFQKFDSIGE